MEELRQLLQSLKQPEYVHVLLNPLPVYALSMGALALVIALLMRSRPAQVAALIVVIIGFASAYPVLHYGQRGYDRVYAMSNADAQEWLDLHMWRAETFVYVFYAGALLAVGTLIAMRKFQRAATPLAIVTLLAALLSVAVGGWISHAGGQVRHSEFREGPPPHAVEHDAEHDHHRES
ncbi:MAG: hypothetical protein HUU46_02885 [Candidatus Hydrogenedentes bacterium]|nr:hypothetical protein [Candidatus Hydrogenedentota bacterium]